VIGVLLLVVVVGTYFWWQEIKKTQEADNSQQEARLRQDFGGQSVVPTDWKTYTNTEYGFEFKYPNEWTIEDTFEKGAINLISPELLKALKALQLAGQGDVPPNIIGIYSRDNTNNLSLLEFTKNYENGWFTEYKLKTNTTVDGHSAIKYSDENVIAGSVPLIATFIQLKNKVLIAQLQYGEEGMVKMYDQILSTFKFTK